MEILPQVDMSAIKIRDSVYYYTVGKNLSHHTLRFALEVYGIEYETMKPINIVTVHFEPIFKDSHLSIAHLAIHTVTGLEYSEKNRELKGKKIRVWKVGG